MLRKFFLISALILATSLYGNELQDDIDKATQIIEEFQTSKEEIPPQILKDAKGIAILQVLKVAVLASGRGGKGLIVAKSSKGWSAPSAIGVGGAGLGAQVGGEVTDLVIILNTQNAVDTFAKGGNFELGGNLSMAEGPQGTTSETALMNQAEIFTYSKSRGLFVGVSLEGTILQEREDANAEFYGKKGITADEILSGKVSQPKSAKALYKELDRYK
jgi:lipid-binding SYLF domain-containing protein